MLAASAAGLPLFILYFGVGVGLTGLFAILYMLLTPHDELKLIREGNVAAALALGGNLAGFSIPLNKAITQAGSIMDCLLWACIALVVQLMVYVLVKTVIPQLSEKIEANNVAVSTFLVFVAVVSGMLNAASMTLSPLT
jgi:putative membrane protein